MQHGNGNGMQAMAVDDVCAQMVTLHAQLLVVLSQLQHLHTLFHYMDHGRYDSTLLHACMVAFMRQLAMLPIAQRMQDLRCEPRSAALKALFILFPALTSVDKLFRTSRVHEDWPCLSAWPQLRTLEICCDGPFTQLHVDCIMQLSQLTSLSIFLGGRPLAFQLSDMSMLQRLVDALAMQLTEFIFRDDNWVFSVDCTVLTKLQKLDVECMEYRVDVIALYAHAPVNWRWLRELRLCASRCVHVPTQSLHDMDVAGEQRQLQAIMQPFHVPSPLLPQLQHCYVT